MLYTRLQAISLKSFAGAKPANSVAAEQGHGGSPVELVDNLAHIFVTSMSCRSERPHQVPVAGRTLMSAFSAFIG